MLEPSDLNPTLERFEYPGLLVKGFEHWSVLLRRHQVTLGSLVLIAHDDATAWSDLEPAAFAELHAVTGAIERTLKTVFAHDKINYLMLMMVDPNVHFHVFPRYGRDLDFDGMTFKDMGWPKTPDMGSGPKLEDDRAAKLMERLKAGWQD